MNKYKDSLNSHQNRGPRAMGVLKSQSVRQLLSKPCIKVEKGAGKVCFMTETWYVYGTEKS